MTASAKPAAGRDEADFGTPLPYFVDPTEVYRHIAPLGDAALLDSGGSDRGRWDILAAAPEPAAGLQLEASLEPRQLQSVLDRFHEEAARRCRPPATDGDGSPGRTRATSPPFCGGYIGHVSYELGRRLQGLPGQRIHSPLAAVRFYPWSIVQDRRRQRSWLVGDYDAKLAKRLRSVLEKARCVNREPQAEDHFALAAPFSPAWSPADFERIFDRVREYIHAGDCYQINIGQPFRARFEGSLLAAYTSLRGIARAPYSAYLAAGNDRTLMCLSPERFLSVVDREVETRPIKGTRPRSSAAAEDRAAARELLSSEKERAENLMIVDLLRNDIGRYCRPGSVHVDTLFGLESYATVHHLVSSIRGTLADGVTPLQLFLGCLPGGSITGAPKRRAMQIIDELEPEPRQAWCGSVFYLSCDGRLDSNLTIRTLFREGQELVCWAGGGLVADSRVADEYREQKDKVGAFLEALARHAG